MIFCAKEGAYIHGPNDPIAIIRLPVDSWVNWDSDNWDFVDVEVMLGKID